MKQRSWMTFHIKFAQASSFPWLGAWAYLCASRGYRGRIHRRTLEALHVFQCLERRVLSKIASRMVPVVKYPDEQICHHVEDADTIFILEVNCFVFEQPEYLNQNVIGWVSVSDCKHKHFSLVFSPQCVWSQRFIVPPVIFQNVTLFVFTWVHANNVCSVHSWELKAYGCCRVWKIKAKDLLEIVDVIPDGKERLFKGLSWACRCSTIQTISFCRFQHFLLERMSLYDEKHLIATLQSEFGRQLSKKDVARIKKEIEKVKHLGHFLLTTCKHTRRTLTSLCW